MLTGGEFGANHTLQGQTLAGCQDEAPSYDVSCLNGCAMSNGDPHLVTIDDRGYEFQAAGEFVLLRANDGTFEIQARPEP